MLIQRLKANWFSLLLAGLLLIFAVAKYRHGMIRTDGNDLAMPYFGARAWMEGSNPYESGNLQRILYEADGQSFKLFNLKYLPPVYPPTAFVLLAPLAKLNWPHAMLAWEVAAIAMFVLALNALLHLAGIGWRDPRAALLVLFCIVFAPLRNSFAMGQNAFLVVCLAAISADALYRRRDALAGCLLAAAICLKPHDAVLFLIYFALLGRWRAMTWTIGVAAVITTIAIVWPGLSHLGWIPEWLWWVRDAAAPGGVNDPSALGPARFQLLHLPVVLFTVLESRTLVAIINVLAGGLLGALAAIVLFRRRTVDLLGLSVVATFSLVPLFHRFPDAALLVFPMAWAIDRLSTPRERDGRIALLLLLPFLIQPYDVIPQLYARGIVSKSINNVWWWECFARGSLVWITLLLSCWVIFLLWRERTARDLV